MMQHEVVRVLNDQMFFVNVKSESELGIGYYVEVLNAAKSYKTLARVIEVYDKYAICEKLGRRKVFYGDEVRFRPRYD
ncbi:hypothetical protein MUA26_01670 [Staphylococcus sp. IVB6246]|nr:MULTISPECIES: hypothetical protein [unclassified Staphylococcus]UXR69878.1 hypothetical protein MUA26_01670 [Staphylococcus sp. IVB6246]UXR71917.1 hypothetical protein MUA88_01645 [Staphylococcus sp. IVB6240]UXR74225.1 hypothetical protein MUA48_01820 [Staphylococcus sp. IVB6238]UXR80743.1 hypothetical protein MUA65_01800 [Staphylococcus sp. IVB6218]